MVLSVSTGCLLYCICRFTGSDVVLLNKVSVYHTSWKHQAQEWCTAKHCWHVLAPREVQILEPETDERTFTISLFYTCLNLYPTLNQFWVRYSRNTPCHGKQHSPAIWVIWWNEGEKNAHTNQKAFHYAHILYKFSLCLSELKQHNRDKADD